MKKKQESKVAARYILFVHKGNGNTKIRKKSNEFSENANGFSLGNIEFDVLTQDIQGKRTI